MITKKLHQFTRLILMLVITVVISCYLILRYSVSETERLLTSDGWQVATACDEPAIRLPAALPYTESATQAVLPSTFSLLSWNMQKGAAPEWNSAVERYKKEVDLLLLQEAVQSNKLRSVLSGRGWQQSVAFDYWGRPAGVLTAFWASPFWQCSFLYSEPLIRFPKSVLGQLFAIENSEHALLLVNLHGINFTLGLTDFEQQMAVLWQLIAQHQGPVIMAGDFNTWSQLRTEALQRRTTQYHLSAVPWAPDNRTRFIGYALDHIYFRGIKLGSSKVVETTQSDHHLLLAQFSIE